MQVNLNYKRLYFDHYFEVAFLVLILLARLLPHPPNVSPLTMIAFLLPSYYPKKAGFWLFILSVIVSDCFLSLLYHVKFFGGWKLITYSGFAIIYCLGSLFNIKNFSFKQLFYLPILSLSYWIWTNFGVWFIYEFYANSIEGLVLCFVAALPFLVNSIVGDLVWSMVILSSLWAIKKYSSTERALLLKNPLKPMNS